MAARVCLLVAIIGAVSAEFVCDAAKGEVAPDWSTVPCSKGTKVRFCLPTAAKLADGTGAASYTNYQTQTFLTEDCTENAALKAVAEACGFKMVPDEGFNFGPPCDLAANPGCSKAIKDYTGDTNDVFKALQTKCKAPACDSPFGCCPDGKTGAKGAHNRGCCQYTTIPSGSGVCDLKGVCGSSVAQKECFGAVGTDYTNAGMKDVTCYCDAACGITKDCCDGMGDGLCGNLAKVQNPPDWIFTPQKTR